MAEEEISTLLLKVGVDFTQIEQFVAALPVVVDVAAAVGQQLDALRIGNPDVFREKGAQLSRALVAGFQAEALGLQFGGRDIAGIITERVFGQLDPGIAQNYVRDVQKILDNVRLQLPELNAPLVSQQALNALGQVGSLAGNSRRELEGLSNQLDGVIGRLSALSEVRLPQRLVQRTVDGDFVPTAGARRAAQALGVPLRDTVQPVLTQTSSRTTTEPRPSLAGTSAALGQVLGGERRSQTTALELQQRELQQSISSQILNAARVATPVLAPITPIPVATGQDAVVQLSQAAQRAATAVERLERTVAASTQRSGRPLDTVTPAGELFSKTEVAIQAAQTRGQVDIFDAIAASPRPEPERNRLPVPIFPREQTASTPVPAGRLEQLEAEVAARRFRQLRVLERKGRLDEIVSNQRGFPTDYIDSRDLPQVSQAEAARFARARNEASLSALDVRGQRDGPTANNPEVDAQALGGIIGGRALDSLLAGRGIDVAAQRRLTEEQREALGSDNAGKPTQRLFPPGLITVADARRELLAGSEEFQPAPRPLRASLAQVRRSEQQVNAADERSRQREIESSRQGDVQRESQRLANQRDADRRASENARRQQVLAQENARATAAAAQEATRLASLPFPVANAFPAPGGLSLGYGPPRGLRPEDVNPDAAYRALGQAGYDAMLAAGKLTLPPGSKYQEQYFNESFPLGKYLGRSGPQIAAEVTDRSLLQRADNGFTVNRGEIPASAVRVVQIDRKTGAVSELPNPFRDNVAGGIPGAPPLGAERRAAAAATASTTAAEQQLGASARTLASARTAASSQLPFGERAEPPRNRLPAATISDAENARRRQALQDQSRFENERRARAQEGQGPRPGSRRPGSPSGPALEGDIFDRFGNPVGAGGSRGGGGGRGGSGFPPPGPLGDGEPRPGSGGAGGAVGAARGFLGGVRTGLLGSGDNTSDFLGRSIGSAARFSLVYAAAYSSLRLFSGGFSQAVQETIGFETALTDLNIATERSGRSNEAFALSLVNLGASRGVGPGEAVAAGARAIGLFDATDSSRAAQEAIARQSVDTATKLAFLAPGTPVEQIQTQVAGITRSFDVDPLDQERVADVASFIGRRTGRPGAEVLASLGQIGSLGENAGFDLEQVAAIIARLTSTTGQTPQAVSGFLSQVLSRADDPRLQETLRGVGVTTEGTTLAQQIEQLSKLNLSKGQTNQIVSGFGRGRSGQALGIILEQFPEIQALASGARTQSGGLANKDFEQAVNTVGGTLRTLSAEIKDLFVGIASSGLLDPLVALLSGISQVVNALDFLVDGFNQIPREARTAAFALAGVFAALALFSRIGPGLALARAAGLTDSTVGRTRRFGKNKGDDLFDDDGKRRTRTDFEGSNAARARAVATGIGAAAGGAATSALGAVGGTALGGAVGGALGVGAIAAGAVVLGAGAILAGAIIGVAASIREAGAVENLLTESGIAVNTASTVEELDTALRQAEESKRAAEERDDFKFLSKDILTLGGANLVDEITGDSRKQRDEAEAQILEGEKRRKELEERDKTIDPFTILGGFSSTEGVADGLKQLSERGLTAAQQLDVLNGAFDALLSTTGPTGASAVLLKGQGPELASVVSTNLIKDLDARQKVVQEAAKTGRVEGFFGSGITGFAKAFDGKEVEDQREQLRKRITEAKPGSREKADLEKDLEAIRFKEEEPGIGRFNDIFGDAGKGFVQDFKYAAPFLRSDSEVADQDAKQAREFKKELRKPETLENLNKSVLGALNEKGLNPTGGPTSLGPDDVKLIRERVKESVLRDGGDAFKGLSKKEQEVQLDAITKSVTQSIEGFAGVDVTASNGRAYLDSVRALAGKAGQDKALTSGSELEGAQAAVDILLEGRSKLDQSIGKIDEEANLTGDKAPTDERRKQLSADREKQVQLLAQYDLETRAAIKARTAAARQDIQSITDLDKSLLQEGDVQGNIAADLRGVAEQLALPELEVGERRALEAQRNKLNQQSVKDVRDTTASRALNAISPRDVSGRLSQQVSNLQRDAEAAPVGSLARSQLEGQVLDLQVQQEDRGIALLGQLALNDINPRNSFGRVNQEISNAQARLALFPDGLEAEQIVGEINGLNDSLAVYALDLAAAVGQLGINPNDSQASNRATLGDANRRLRDAMATGDPLAIAQSRRAQELAQFQVGVSDPIALGNARNLRTADGSGLRDATIARENSQRDLGQLVPGTPEFEAKQAEIAGNLRAERAQQVERAKASRRSQIDPGNDLANARADVLDAQLDLSLQPAQSREYYEALTRLRATQSGLANLEKEAARRTRRLSTDSTDSLTQAREDVEDARQRLVEAQQRGGDTSAEQQALEGAQAQERDQAFNRGLNDAQIANDLGQTSNTQYLDYLTGERERLAARVAALRVTDEGYRQALEQLQQIDQAIQAANEQFTGQFNLGDIDVPSVFQVRQQLAGGTGAQTSNVQNVQIVVNGGDLNEVKAVMAQYLGASAFGRTSLSTQKI